MNAEDLYQTLAIVLLILTLLKIDITQMMSTTWKEFIFLAFVFITVIYMPFPYGILLQVICKGMELLMGHLSKTRSRPEKPEKPGNEKLNSRFTLKSSKSELAATTKETENAKELEPSLFESSMLRKLTELIERIEQQNVEITNQQKELIQQRKTFNQKQDQMEGKIKQLLDEQRNMNKQEKVLRCERKIY